MSNLITRFRRLIMGDDSEIELGIQPAGSLSITANGTYDVTEYAEADVNITGNIPEISTITQRVLIRNYTDIILTVTGVINRRKILTPEHLISNEYSLIYDVADIPANSLDNYFDFPFYPDGAAGSSASSLARIASAIGKISPKNMATELPDLKFSNPILNMHVNAARIHSKSYLFFAYNDRGYEGLTINIQLDTENN